MSAILGVLAGGRLRNLLAIHQHIAQQVVLASPVPAVLRADH